MFLGRYVDTMVSTKAAQAVGQLWKHHLGVSLVDSSVQPKTGWVQGGVVDVLAVEVVQGGPVRLHAFDCKDPLDPAMGPLHIDSVD